MKRTLLAFALTLSLWFGCKKDEGGGSTPGTNPNANYFPFVLNRSWQYNTSGTLPNGQIDPRSLHTMTATVFQMNQNIGGQPNATILRATYSNNNNADNLIFYAEPTKLWAYLGAGETSNYTNYLSWHGWGTTLYAAVNKTEKYWVYDWQTYQGVPCQIVQSPQSSIATARIIAPDTLEVRGIGAGITSVRLARVGSITDTMTVSILVGNETRAYGPTTNPWMPFCQVFSSTSEQVLYSWDSTFVFSKLNGTRLRDRATYKITSRLLGNENVSAAGGTISCEKYVIQILITETVDSLIGAATYPVFSGPSLQMTGNLWIANDVGPVKGEISGQSLAGRRGFYGSSIYSFTGTGQYSQSYFFSDRLFYYYYQFQGTQYFEDLSIDTRPLQSSGTYSFVLAAKSF